MKVLKCDVCGAIYDLDLQDRKLRIVDFGISGERKMEPKYFDLCPACQYKLREFVNYSGSVET